jgi:hypothetical protein
VLYGGFRAVNETPLSPGVRQSLRGFAGAALFWKRCAGETAERPPPARRIRRRPFTSFSRGLQSRTRGPVAAVRCPPLRRRLLDLLTALSLLLCVAASAWWVRSHHASDRILYQTGEDPRGHQRCFELCSNRGVLVFRHHHIAGLGRAYAEKMSLHTERGEPAGEPLRVRYDRKPVLPGFSFDPPITTFVPPATWWRYSVQVPHYAVVIAAGVPPVARLRSHRRRRGGDTRGLCTGCGYNLTGNVSGVCPECGRVR